MIIQLGAFFGSAFTQLGGLVQSAAPGILAAGLDIGKQFVGGLINRELNRVTRRNQDDAVKAALRAASNAVSPLVAPGQGPTFTGGPPVGSAFIPPTLIPPSILPPARNQQINPGFTNVSSFQSREQSRRMGGLEGPAQAGFVRPLVTGAQRLRDLFLRRPLSGAAAGAVAVETGAAVATDFLFPSTAFAPTRGFFPTEGDPLQIGSDFMPNGTAVPTGLPAIGRYQKEANGCFVQWYFFDGNNHVPISRKDAKECIKKECIYRLDVFRGKFVKLQPRRINPMNVRAFFRAGRRVDAGERICRKMFQEKRKQKTGTIRRKSSHRKK